MPTCIQVCSTQSHSLEEYRTCFDECTAQQAAPGSAPDFAAETTPSAAFPVAAHPDAPEAPERFDLLAALGGGATGALIAKFGCPLVSLIPYAGKPLKAICVPLVAGAMGAAGSAAYQKAADGAIDGNKVAEGAELASNAVMAGKALAWVGGKALVAGRSVIACTRDLASTAIDFSAVRTAVTTAKQWTLRAAEHLFNRP